MNWVHYLLLANIYTAVFLIFYLMLLKKETFFQLNRLYLLGTLIASFILPGLHPEWINQTNIVRKIPVIDLNAINISGKPSLSPDHFTAGQIALFIYLAGMIIFSAHLIIRLLAVKKLLNAPGISSSFSFFKKIYLGHNINTDSPIGIHEKTHAAQWHSADILFSEIMVILNWFNPVVYLFRKELKNVHEFIADEGALRSAGSKKEYAMLLLSQTFETPINNLVNTFFNENLLKQRIIMIQKTRSHKKALLKYGLSAPLLALMLLFSSATVGHSPSGLLRETHPAKNKQSNKDHVYSAVDHVPTYPGGVNKFYEFLARNIKYPAAMREKTDRVRKPCGF
jgi:hypothetical protein